MTANPIPQTSVRPEDLFPGEIINGEIISPATPTGTSSSRTARHRVAEQDTTRREGPETYPSPDGGAAPHGQRHDADRLTERLATRCPSWTGALLDAPTVLDTMTVIANATARAVAAAEMVCLTVWRPDDASPTLVGTHDSAVELDQVQCRCDSGPCPDAARPGGTDLVHSDDLHDEPRWPAFTTAATAHGYGSVLSASLLPDAGSDRLRGALTIYCHQPHGLTALDRHTVLLMASHGGLALTHKHAVEQASQERTHLQRCLEVRDLIGQAKGILISQHTTSADHAFDILRSTARARNMSLAAVAREVITQHAIPQ